MNLEGKRRDGCKYITLFRVLSGFAPCRLALVTFLYATRDFRGSGRAVPDVPELSPLLTAGNSSIRVNKVESHLSFFANLLECVFARLLTRESTRCYVKSRFKAKRNKISSSHLQLDFRKKDSRSSFGNSRESLLAFSRRFNEQARLLRLSTWSVSGSFGTSRIYIDRINGRTRRSGTCDLPREALERCRLRIYAERHSRWVQLLRYKFMHLL